MCHICSPGPHVALQCAKEVSWKLLRLNTSDLQGHLHNIMQQTGTGLLMLASPLTLSFGNGHCSQFAIHDAVYLYSMSYVCRYLRTHARAYAGSAQRTMVLPSTGLYLAGLGRWCRTPPPARAIVSAVLVTTGCVSLCLAAAVG